MQGIHPHYNIAKKLSKLTKKSKRQHFYRPQHKTTLTICLHEENGTAREVKSPPACRSVHQNANIFKTVRIFDHILLP